MRCRVNQLKPGSNRVGKVKTVTTLPFSKLYSHPDKALEKHLINSAELALQNLSQSPVESFDIFNKKF